MKFGEDISREAKGNLEIFTSSGKTAKIKCIRKKEWEKKRGYLQTKEKFGEYASAAIQGFLVVVIYSKDGFIYTINIFLDSLYAPPVLSERIMGCS